MKLSKTQAEVVILASVALGVLLLYRSYLEHSLALQTEAIDTLGEQLAAETEARKAFYARMNGHSDEPVPEAAVVAEPEPPQPPVSPDQAQPDA